MALTPSRSRLFLRTCRPASNPCSDLSHELLMGKRRNAASRSRIPGPIHEPVVADVFYQLLWSLAAVGGSIFKHPADIAHAQPLPRHTLRGRWQAPVRPARRRVKLARIFRLMAIGAAHSGRAPAIRPALNVHVVSDSGIALQGRVSGN